MDYPLDSWLVFSPEEFETAAVRDPGDLGVELLAQVRQNGRLVDHCRLVVGGSKPVETTFELQEIFTFRGNIPAWRMGLAIWPREILIRRNMATSTWLDIRDLVAQRDILVTDGGANDDEVDPGEFAALFEGTSSSSVSSSIRWAVCAGADDRIHLELQGLPFSAAVLNSKPLYKG